MDLLQTQLERIAPAGVVVGCRRIEIGDDRALLPEEAAPLTHVVESSRRASGAARLIARHILERMGYPRGCQILRSPSGAPIWPDGMVGSLAHDQHYAVAAITRQDAFRGLGIDIEPAVDLPQELLELVATPEEIAATGGDPFKGRMLFVAKEAVYKATNPLDGVFLEHHDVEIDFAQGIAVVRHGLRVDVRLIDRPRIVAIATIRGRQK
jgi:4'-phosphopantetheinyl transferase EntD